MRSTLLFLLLTAFTLNASVPELKKITAGGFEREYLFYAPSKTKPKGMIVAIHGFNRNMFDFFEDYSLTKIADSLNYLIIAPQALPEQSDDVYADARAIKDLTGKEIPLDAVWACGLRFEVEPIAILGSFTIIDAELNKTVDDVDFIGSIIRKTIDEQKLDANNIFLVGTSMGGYMSYQYALLQPVKISGIVSIAGSMGLSIKGKENNNPLPVCNFHSLDDEVVPYSGSYEIVFVEITLAEHTDSVINYWRRVNNTAEPVVENFPSSNGKTVQKITYPHSDNEVINYKIEGAPHSYFFRSDSGDCMDYVKEITKFIAAHSAVSNEVLPYGGENALQISPNPAYNIVRTSVSDGYAVIYDLSGRKMLSAPIISGILDVSPLNAGLYILKVGTKTCRLVKK
ncbi:MAG: T9SS type A sorting domain-containing protein [Tannerella sp.]|jgi:poly(3-hydroxybutyrate) depolymerase|nr:T9SS type A sorting domain-containing protein [Tannerella sp.]